jgi:purine-binding chemotaxis protein CheW
VPVIDLKARFGRGETDTEKSNVVVIVMIGDKLHGLLVDAVSGILTVEPGDVAPVPQTGGDDHTGLLSGIITDDERMVAVIALDALN